MSLELAAMRWLWIEQKCLVVLEKRTPKYGMGEPDVLGITPGRYMTEIEIKRSRADFKKDFEKPHRMVRNGRQGELRRYAGMGELLKFTNHPRQFYYMMPRDLAEKLKDEIPAWAGLMTTEKSGPWAKLLKIAPVNKDSTKLDIKDCARLARKMTAHMMGYAIANNTIQQSYNYRCDYDFAEWIDAEKGTYQI